MEWKILLQPFTITELRILLTSSSRRDGQELELVLLRTIGHGDRVGSGEYARREGQ